MEFASNAKGNTGVTLGAIGTGLGLLGGLGGLWGGNSMFNGSFYNGQFPQYATKDDITHALIIAQKDSEIAMLRSEQNTEIKIADVYERVMKRVNEDKAEQQAINQQQAVYNCAANSNIRLLQAQVEQLMGLTQLKIPNASISPGWDTTASATT